MYELKSGIFRILIFFQLNECIYEMCALMNENNIVRETLFLEKIYDTLSSYCQTCYLTRENMLHFFCEKFICIQGICIKHYITQILWHFSDTFLQNLFDFMILQF